jgi:prepilin-type N-terminal cleavage/methylation domain-containing protein
VEPTRNTAARHDRGFTMIEMIVVLAVIALLFGSVIIGLSSAKQAEIVRSTNQIANTIRFAFNKSRVTGDYYRLAINMDDNTIVLQRGDDRMYLPATDRDGKPVVYDAGKEKEREERDKRAEEAYNRSLQAMVFSGGAAGAAASGDGALGAAAGGSNPYLGGPKRVPRRKPPLFGGFEEENSISGFKEPVPLPEGVKVISVRTAEDIKPITAGEASVYFFPQGRTQLAHIQLEEARKDGNKYTIVVQPLTGQVEILEGHVDLVIEEEERRRRDDLGREQDRRSF